jgi:two-component system sensor histidine kinase MtrB
MTAVADILGDGTAGSADGTAAARLVGQEIRHLNRLVEDLIEISRFDAGSARLIAEDTDVVAAVQECLRARSWAGVCCTVPAGLTVRLDRRRFDVIVANLVGNALRHGEPPVTVRASVQGALAASSELVLQVRDHGPGLPAGAIGQVFDRFYKADSARARSEGSGLGLAIAQENARLHGGRIDAASDPGGGAVFTVRLPVH